MTQFVKKSLTTNTYLDPYHNYLQIQDIKKLVKLKCVADKVRDEEWFTTSSSRYRRLSPWNGIQRIKIFNPFITNDPYLAKLIFTFICFRLRHIN